MAPDGVTRTWTYVPGSGRLQSEQHPESGLTSYVYDSAGVLAQKTDANGTEFTYTRDGNDRVKAESASGRVTTTFFEPGSDNRRLTSVGAVSAEFFYDAAGRVSARHDTVDGRIFRTGYEYDANDNLTAIRYPALHPTNTRRLVQFEYDAERRLTRVFEGSTNYASNLQYHPSGALTRYTAGNGLETVLAFDAFRYWPTSIAAGALGLQYQDYDGVGNVGTIADSRAGMNQTFTYDPLDRLLTANGAYGATTYAYDAHGNRQTSGGTTYTYEPGKLRLASQGTSTFGYDANGNLTTAPNATFTYAPRNMLETATVIGGTTTYRYDADDWRAKKSGQGTNTYYIRGLDQQVLTEWSNPGPSGQTRDYIYAGSRLIAVVKRATSDDVTDLYFTIIPDGPAVDVPFTAPGQRALLTFDGVAGRRMSVLSTVTSSACLNWPMAILKPDGTTLVSKNGCGTEFLEPVSLPVSGTYTVVIDPNGAYVGTATVQLYDVVDITGPVEPDGAAVPVALLKVGQKAYLTFEGLAGRRMSVLSTVGSSACLNWPMAILKPDGTTLVSKNSCGTEFLEPVSLPVSGTYTILIDPREAYVGTATVRLYDVVDITDSIEPDGAAVPVALLKVGQKAYLTFEGLAGRRMSVLSTVGSSACLNWPMAILKPDGTTLVSKSGCGTEFLEPVSLPVSGTYTIAIDPREAYVGTATVRLYDVVDLTGGIAVNGASVPLTLSDVGQVARLTFDGVPGQPLTVRLTSNTASTTLVQLLRPDGTVMTSRSSSLTNFNLTTQTLSTAGTYTVVVDPLNANTGTITVAVTNP